MMRHSRRGGLEQIVGAFALVATFSGFSQESHPGLSTPSEQPVLTLTGYLQEVTDRNPLLMEKRSRVESAKAVAEGSGKIQEPRVGFGFMNVPVSPGPWLARI